MTRICLLAALALLPSAASASGPQEPGRKSVAVEFDNGHAIEIRCEDERCTVHCRVDQGEFDFDAGELKATVLPLNPVLFSMNNLPGTFSFELPIECPDQPSEPPFPACYGNYSVEDGEIVERHLYSETAGRTTPLR